MGMKPIGTKSFSQKLRLAKKLYPVEVDLFLVNIGLRLLGMTKLRTAVVTGHLRRNWKIAKVVSSGRVKSIQVFNNVVYAPHYEFGTERYEGKYPLNRSVTELESQMPKLVEDLFKRTLGDLLE